MWQHCLHYCRHLRYLSPLVASTSFSLSSSLCPTCLIASDYDFLLVIIVLGCVFLIPFIAFVTENFRRRRNCDRALYEHEWEEETNEEDLKEGGRNVERNIIGPLSLNCLFLFLFICPLARFPSLRYLTTLGTQSHGASYIPLSIGLSDHSSSSSSSSAASPW